MSEHVHNGWTIHLYPTQHDNGLWICPYTYTRTDQVDALTHRNEPAGLWDTKEEAEAASLAHATAWIDAECTP